MSSGLRVVIATTFPGNCGQLHGTATCGRPLFTPTTASGGTVSPGSFCLHHIYKVLDKNVKLSSCLLIYLSPSHWCIKNTASELVIMEPANIRWFCHKYLSIQGLKLWNIQNDIVLILPNLSELQLITITVVHTLIARVHVICALNRGLELSSSTSGGWQLHIWQWGKMHVRGFTFLVSHYICLLVLP